jgi:hypothetical protein
VIASLNKILIITADNSQFDAISKAVGDIDIEYLHAENAAVA